VVLNACHTFTQAGHESALSVAKACIRGGVNVVVSMQAPIGDDAAVSFSKVFYRSLVTGDAPQQSMVAARQNLRNLNLAFNTHWCIPTLILAEVTQQGLFKSSKDGMNELDSFQEQINDIQRAGMMKRLQTHFEYWLLLDEERAGYGRNPPPKLVRDIEYRQMQIVELQNQLGLDALPVEWQVKRRESQKKQLIERQKALQILQQLSSEDLKPMERIEVQREIETFECEIQLLEYSL
jgi:hypothetical protein